MKKIFYTLVLFIGFALSMNAQSYNSAVGARLGSYSLTASYKQFLTESSAFELFGGFAYEGTALNVNALYLMHTPIPSVENLSWYWGGGVSTNLNPFTLGVMGAIGVDYKLEDYPVNLTLDYLPTLGIVNSKGLYYRGVTLAVRYVLN